MKKQYLPLIVLLTTSLLAGCDNKGETSQEELDFLDNNISLFSKGFLMSGYITQTRAPAISIDDNGNYVFSPTKEKNEYQTNIGFQNVGRNAFEKKSTQEFEGELQSMENYVYFEDENGLAYSETLNYKNEVERNYSINYANSSFASNGFYNFFTILQKGDFIQSEEEPTRYDLNLDKAGIISNNLLYSLNSGFATAVKEAYFTVENDIFKNFFITMNSYYYIDNNYLYEVENDAVFSLQQVGTYKIPSVHQYEAKNYTALDKALKELGNNYTMNVEKISTDAVTGKSTTSFQDFYFTGKEIYVHSYTDENDAAPNRENDFYLAPEEDNRLYSYVYDADSSSYVKKTTTGFPSLYQGKYTYEDCLPLTNEVSSDLFVYDEATKIYSPEDEAKSSLIKCFYLRNPAFKSSQSNSFYDADVVLAGEHIAFIELPFSYTDFMEGTIVTGSYRLTYKNIGSTVNPK